MGIGNNSGFGGGTVPASGGGGVVLHTVPNRLTASHEGWQIGDIVSQTGDLFARIASVTFTQTTPNNGQIFILSLFDELGQSCDAVISANTSPADAATAMATAINLAEPINFTAVSLGAVVTITSKIIGALPSSGGLNGDGSWFIQDNSNPNNQGNLPTILTIVQVDHDGVLPGKFIVASSNNLVDSASYAVGAEAIRTTNEIYVSTTGSDRGGDGSLNHPFASLGTALAIATSGTTINVLPGAYNVTDSILKDGVNWFFAAGAKVTYSVIDDFKGIIDDTNTGAVVCQIRGAGDFLKDFRRVNVVGTQNACVLISNPASDVSIKCHSILSDALNLYQQPTSYMFSVAQSAGRLALDCEVIPAGLFVNSAGLWWGGGNGTLRVNRLLGGSQKIWSQVDGTQNANWTVQCDVIDAGDGSFGPYCVWSNGSDETSALWVNSTLIYSAMSNWAILSEGANKVYIHAQKIKGSIETRSGAGLLYVTTEKLEQNYDSALNNTYYPLAITAGNCFVRITHLEPKSFAGLFALISGGELYFEGGYLKGNTTSDGFTISGGTTRLKGVVLDTSANSNANPINKTGGILILDDVTLVAQASRNSIAAADAQTVVNYGSRANRAASSNVTVQVDAIKVDVNVR